MELITKILDFIDKQPKAVALALLAIIASGAIAGSMWLNDLKSTIDYKNEELIAKQVQIKDLLDYKSTVMAERDAISKQSKELTEQRFKNDLATLKKEKDLLAEQVNLMRKYVDAISTETNLLRKQVHKPAKQGLEGDSSEGQDAVLKSVNNLDKLTEGLQAKLALIETISDLSTSFFSELDAHERDISLRPTVTRPWGIRPKHMALLMQSLFAVALLIFLATLFLAARWLRRDKRSPKPVWPRELSARLPAVRNLLAELGEAAAADVPKRFKGVTAEEAQNLLESLAAIDVAVENTTDKNRRTWRLR